MPLILVLMQALMIGLKLFSVLTVSWWLIFLPAYPLIIYFLAIVSMADDDCWKNKRGW